MYHVQKSFFENYVSITHRAWRRCSPSWKEITCQEIGQISISILSFNNRAVVYGNAPVWLVLAFREASAWRCTLLSKAACAWNKRIGHRAGTAAWSIVKSFFKYRQDFEVIWSFSMEVPRSSSIATNLPGPYWKILELFVSSLCSIRSQWLKVCMVQKKFPMKIQDLACTRSGAKILQSGICQKKNYYSSPNAVPFRFKGIRFWSVNIVHVGKNIVGAIISVGWKIVEPRKLLRK